MTPVRSLNLRIVSELPAVGPGDDKDHVHFSSFQGTVPTPLLRPMSTQQKLQNMYRYKIGVMKPHAHLEDEKELLMARIWRLSVYLS